ncbi:MAG: extracellular solute-binding protein [Bacteroidetes bacterium]|nr:extracellular solute-binding protein [Bacteroidota bacterium]MCL5026961.1 extracellular solute-binding protein [Chloroflexota bacterium]
MTARGSNGKYSRRSFLKAAALAGGALAAAPILQACAPGAAPEPAKPGAAGAGGKISVKDKLVVIQMQDWHPDHNKLVRDTIQKYSDGQGWPLDISYTEGFLAGGNIIQKLTAAVQAGDPPDLMFHSDAITYQLKFLDLLVDMDDITKEMITAHGKPYAYFEKVDKVDGKWMRAPFFGRLGQYWVREDIFKAAGLDVEKDTATYDKLRDACLKASDPAKEMWGWGMTINRCGDGHSLVLNTILAWGGSITEETGQYIVLNSPETVAGIKWLTEIYQDPKWAKMLPPGVGAWTDPQNNETFLAGKIAVTQNAGTMYAKAVVDKLPFADKIVWRPVPGGPKRQKSDGAGSGFWSFRGSKNVAAAKELIKALLDDEIARPMFKTALGYAAPAYEKMWDYDFIKADRNSMAWKKGVWDDPDPGYADPWPGPPTAAAAAVKGANVLTDMTGAVLGGTKIEDAVKAAHDRAVQIYKEFGMKAVKA